MTKKQNELKNALQTLKVNEALRLSKGPTSKDFAFKPPEPSEINSSSVQTNPSLPKPELETNSAWHEPSLSQAKLENGSNQNNSGTIRSQTEMISAQSDPGSKSAEVESISVRGDLGANSSPLPLSPGENIPSAQRSKINSSSDSNNSTGFDLSPFLSGLGTISLVERGEGSFHIPHRIYEFVHKAVDTKVELLVFNCLLRYTLGFQRATCQASQSFISRWTGIAVPNVRKALKSLIDRSFIRRLEEGTISHDSAVYEVPIVTAYLAHDHSRKLGATFVKSSELEKRSDRRDLGSGPPQIPDQINPKSEIDSIPKKERENINKKKTLSHELPIGLQRYFSELLPKQKSERELKAFENLERQFTVDQVEIALGFVQKHGALEDKTPVHSPMAYLSLSIRDVLKRVLEENAASVRRDKTEQQKIIERQRLQQQEDEEAALFRKKEKAFCSAFPTQERQDDLIREICRRQQFSWNPQGQVARSIAIQTWWDELSHADRQAREGV